MEGDHNLHQSIELPELQLTESKKAEKVIAPLSDPRD